MTDSEEECVKGNESQMGFVLVLRDFPIMFSKSQTPNARKTKSQALEMIKKKWEIDSGTQITTSQLLKKINNMKSRLKKKTDLNRTGNKKIILQDWEKILLEIMEGDTNPVITKIPGAISAGHEQSEHISLTSTVVEETTTDPFPPKKKKKISLLEEYETENTKQLSNSELQRLVLLKQLKVLTMKEEKLKRELSRNENNTNDVIYDQTGNIYFNI